MRSCHNTDQQVADVPGDAHEPIHLWNDDVPPQELEQRPVLLWRIAEAIDDRNPKQPYGRKHHKKVHCMSGMHMGRLEFSSDTPELDQASSGRSQSRSPSLEIHPPREQARVGCYGPPVAETIQCGLDNFVPILLVRHEEGLHAALLQRIEDLDVTPFVSE